MYKLHLVGVGASEHLYGLDEHRLGILGSCGCIVTSERYRLLIGNRDTEFLPIIPVRDAVAAIRDRLLSMDVVVVASGDPLFFGIGRTLIKEFGREQIETVPAVSYMQTAFAKFKEPWDDAEFISLHGRSAECISSMILPHRKVFMFTDGKNSPSGIASELIKEGVAGYSAFVAEDLGAPEERLTSGSLEDIAEGSFSSLSVMILKYEQKQETSALLNENDLLGPFGLREDEIVHSRGLITKSEVRAAVLHRLRLPYKGGGVFWDVGAGSGSVSIEAARICPSLSVYAVEKHPAELENIRTNIKRFATNNISVIDGEAPSCFSGLPEPDRVFVGGSGGRLSEILEHVSMKLKPGGIVIVNAVTERTIRSAPQILLELGFRVESSEVALTRTVWINAAQEEKKMNPIQIIAGER